jgi:ribosomal protein L36
VYVDARLFFLGMQSEQSEGKQQVLQSRLHRLPTLAGRMKIRSSLRRICQSCYFVRRKGRLCVYCKRNPRHKHRQRLHTAPGEENQREEGHVPRFAPSKQGHMSPGPPVLSRIVAGAGLGLNRVSHHQSVLQQALHQHQSKHSFCTCNAPGLMDASSRIWRGGMSAAAVRGRWPPAGMRLCILHTVCSW